MKRMKIEIKKDGRLVARAEHMSPGTMSGVVKGIDVVRYYHFPEIVMVPAVMFEHLAGCGLNKFLDHVDLVLTPEGEIDGQKIPDLRYIHGRSEVMKGKHTVSAVALASTKPQYGEPVWLSKVPEVYAKIMLSLNLQDRSLTRT